MNLHEAIYSLYPQVVVIRGEDAFDKDDNKVDYDKEAVFALVTTNDVNLGTTL
jgi:hypothetical protein